jgi:hypothetical protein
MGVAPAQYAGTVDLTKNISDGFIRVILVPPKNVSFICRDAKVICVGDQRDVSARSSQKPVPDTLYRQF